MKFLVVVTPPSVYHNAFNMGFDFVYLSLLSCFGNNEISAFVIEWNGNAWYLRNTINGAVNNWSVKISIYFSPFCDLDYVIRNAPTALSQDYGQLILEEVVLMNSGKTVTFLISKHHPILIINQMITKQIRDMFKNTMTYNTLKPVQFGTKLFFFSMSLTVRSNAYYENFNRSTKYYNTENI